MFRYALIIVGLLLLVGYIFVLAARGSISGRFRTVSLVLLGLLLLLTGFGYYYSHTQYSVQTVQEEFAANKEDIFAQISQLYSQEDYTQARKLAEQYVQVNDPRLDSWYRRAREAELVHKARDLPPKAHKKRLAIWEELAELTRDQKYAAKAEQARQTMRQARENQLLDRIQALPAKAIAQKALGYELLVQLNPDRALYKQQLRSYSQKVETKIERSPWNDLCASRPVEACKHFGYLVESEVRTESDIQTDTAEICGVSWRPKGTLISRNGEVAPENGTYYLVHDWTHDSLVLIHVNYVQVRHPFPETASMTSGDKL